ncbi:hypothetical protein WJX74_002059 [Apatococcus lobatus]|uniref:tRNA-uridine aminocarboxypropyltransferase n=1 Tax=Apatococcus lobatus TaxID=904363 RepID=A0AAW1Q163_9CHLO
MEPDMLKDFALVNKSSQRDCLRCRRPRTTCLCESLPDCPLRSVGTVLILQHVFEAKRRMATVPLMNLVLRNSQVYRQRSFRVARRGKAAG